MNNTSRHLLIGKTVVLATFLTGCCGSHTPPENVTSGQDSKSIVDNDSLTMPFCSNRQYPSLPLNPNAHPATMSSLWHKTTLEVALMTGEKPDDLWEFVKRVAKEWEVIGIVLRFDTGQPPDIVVSLRQGELLSTIGSFSHGQSPSIFLGRLTRPPLMSKRKKRWAILHEFGHALGYRHEFGNPSAGKIPWNKPAAYAFFAKQKMTPEQVDDQIFSTYENGSTNHSVFDPSSIMLYHLPDSLFSQKMNWTPGFELSPCDKAFGKCLYSAPIRDFKPCPCPSVTS